MIPDFAILSRKVGATFPSCVGYESVVKLRVLGDQYAPNELPSVHFVANTTLSALGAFLLRSACCILEEWAEGQGFAFCASGVHTQSVGGVYLGV